ncbi:MAG: hypothetical protein KGI54_11255 [Pseudomonadota bacterium]|nr:hypothetical protein [Pseudomonadota bacterium]
MINPDAIKEILGHYEIQLCGEPILYAEQPDHVYLYIQVNRNSVNRQVPSNASLKAARELLLERGVTVDFLLFDGATRNAEAGLRATLLHAFGADIRNAFLSIDGKSVHVWVDPKRQLTEAIRKDMSQKAKAFLSQLDLQLVSLASVVGENVPGTFVLLRAIRQLSPVDVKILKTHLLEKGFTVPSDDWVMRRLDAIRKTGRVVRLQNGTYVLALRCIRELGTEKNRRSPDVARLLALNRLGRYS